MGGESSTTNSFEIGPREPQSRYFKSMEEETITPDNNGDKRNPDGTFAIGNKGGPGRPSVSIITFIKKKLAEVPLGQMTTYAEQAADLMVRKAIVDGDALMLREIMHYVDGMPKQKLEVGGDKESIAELTEFFKTVASRPTIETPTFVDTKNGIDLNSGTNAGGAVVIKDVPPGEIWVGNPARPTNG